MSFVLMEKRAINIHDSSIKGDLEAVKYLVEVKGAKVYERGGV